MFAAAMCLIGAVLMSVLAVDQPLWLAVAIWALAPLLVPGGVYSVGALHGGRM
ncbi:MAG: hypothetical protein AB7O32_08070 [Vicinamibacterales bacterium]